MCANGLLLVSFEHHGEAKGTDNPIHRFRAYLVSQGWWSEAEESTLLAKHRTEVLKAFNRAEKLPKPKLGEMFNDVYAKAPGEEIPRIIVRCLSRLCGMTLTYFQSEQRAELGRLLSKYGEVWEPWRRDRQKYVEAGEDIMDSSGRGS